MTGWTAVVIRTDARRNESEYMSLDELLVRIRYVQTLAACTVDRETSGSIVFILQSSVNDLYNSPDEHSPVRWTMISLNSKAGKVFAL